MPKFEEIAHKTWLMDNHQWAFYCWEDCIDKKPVDLIHLDWHWDGINDFHEKEEINHLMNLTDLSSLKELIEENIYIRWDSFIAPAILRGTVDEVHFFCFQDDTEIGLGKKLHELVEFKEVHYQAIDDVINNFLDSAKPYILDLDLDLFNKYSKYYEENKLENNLTIFIDRCSPLIQNAEVITIAKSPVPWFIEETENREWDWNRKIAEKIADIVVPKIINIRKQAL